MPADIEAVDLPSPTETDVVIDDIDTPQTTAPVSQGDFLTSTVDTLNKALAHADFATSFGSGGFAIAEGLAIAAGSGLQLNIGKGIATINGLVTVETNTSISVPGSTSDIRIWLQQNGSIVQVIGNDNPPITNSVYLGKCTTDGSSVTSVNLSGVVYWKSGNLWRETADIWAPGDQPSSNMRLFTKTSSGTFWWNGEEWLLVNNRFASVWKKLIVSFDDINANALTETIDLLTLPAGSVFRGIKLSIDVLFEGTGITDIDFEVGDASDSDRFLVSSDGKSVAVFSNFADIVLSHTDASAVQLKATSVGANLSFLAGGSLCVWINYEVLN